jgi:hypothetical protein
LNLFFDYFADLIKLYFKGLESDARNQQKDRQAAKSDCRSQQRLLHRGVDIDSPTGNEHRVDGSPKSNREKGERNIDKSDNSQHRLQNALLIDAILL